MYIAPNLFPLIVCGLLGIYLCIKYVLKKDREEKDLQTDALDKKIKRIKDMLDTMRYNEEKAQAVDHQIPDEYLLTDHDNDNAHNHDHDHDHHDHHDHHTSKPPARVISKKLATNRAKDNANNHVNHTEQSEQLFDGFIEHQPIIDQYSPSHDMDKAASLVFGSDS
jgi:hypothetical protein